MCALERSRAASQLTWLQFWNSGGHAAKWLLSACGPDLESLNIGIPLGDDDREGANGAYTSTDLVLASASPLPKNGA